MKVRELIAQLQLEDQELEVTTGYDKASDYVLPIAYLDTVKIVPGSGEEKTGDKVLVLWYELWSYDVDWENA